jgi:formamidopyrimidine-DNA glycosylase
MAGRIVSHIVWSLHDGYDNLRRSPLLESQVMPELPEVETVCRGLEPELTGRMLTGVTLRRSNLRYPLPDGFVAKLTSRRVIAVRRRAKFILVQLDNEITLVIHLGMSGRLVIHTESPPPPPGPHDHVDVVTDTGVTIRYNDVRRFGFMDLISDADMSQHPMFAKLGPEPLGNGFNAEMLCETLAGRRTSIKAALLDQHVVAGLGNIYVCESLFRASISPKRNAYTIAGRRAERLVTAIRAVLKDAIAAGGSSLRDYVQASGELGYFQHKFQAYDQEGKPCVMPGCKGTVRRISQSGRSTFYCPGHQR